MEKKDEMAEPIKKEGPSLPAIKTPESANRLRINLFKKVLKPIFRSILSKIYPMPAPAAAGSFDIIIPVKIATKKGKICRMYVFDVIVSLIKTRI